LGELEGVMNFTIKTFIHYFKQNLLVALGVVVSTAVLTGALIIGDSVRYSLKQSTFSRLGETTHLVSVTERYFRQEMAAEIEAANPEIKATSVLLLEGVAVADGGENRVNRAQVIGVDTDFQEISNTPSFSELQDNEIAISQNLADRLQVKEGDNLLVRIKKASLIPMNAPFVSAEETSVSLRATIKKVVQKEELGRFNLKNSQTAPYNIFVSIERLNKLMEFEGKANQILISTNVETEKVAETVKKCLTPTDAGLQLKKIEATNETEISTERVFLEEKISSTLNKLPDAELILTYFVNAIEKKGEGEDGGKGKDNEAAVGSRQSPATTSNQHTVSSIQNPASRIQHPVSGNQSPSITTNHNSSSIPYSFVSSLPNTSLDKNEIILNRWAADDLNAKPGDKIILKYLEIGPLRQLIDKETEFIVKEVIPMDSKWIDATRAPHLPGLSDAGHCREWEAGVPIDLDAIREKDEKYWDDFKGTPKAFVSEGAALQMWSNRFGNYTAVRFPTDTFNEEKYNQLFAQEIEPADLGMAITPIREQGVQAAQNGTDFSGLFIGLSFFLLLSRNYSYGAAFSL
jgi:putative ABC transport system permease protein